ncbi:unnamed protein product, partial [marine sediment metagenome]
WVTIWPLPTLLPNATLQNTENPLDPANAAVAKRPKW